MLLSKNVVNSLRVLADEACYKGIISEFEFIFLQNLKKNSGAVEGQGHPPADIVKVKEDPTEDYVLNQGQRDQALQELRKKLEPRLQPYSVGLFSAERQQFLDRFIKSYRNRKLADVDQNLCLAFFNCLLNGDITTFNLTGGEDYHPFQEVIDPLKLLPIISEHCSTSLQSLGLSFGVPEKVDVPFIPTLCDTLKGFKHLTSLTLSWNAAAEGRDFIPFLTALGDIKLTSLDFGFGFTFDLDHFLALVLGRKYHLLPQQLLDEVRTTNYRLFSVQFTDLSLSPLCSTLQKLDIGDFYKDHPGAGTLSLAIFALRHFTQLQEYLSKTNSRDTIVAVFYLSFEINKFTSSVTSQCSTMVQGPVGTIEWTFNAPYQGQLNLTLLKGVDLNHPSMMLSVIALCPHIEEVHFIYSSSAHHRDNSLTAEQLRSLLTSSAAIWSKVVSIGMRGVPADIRRVVLDCLGGRTLLKLVVNNTTQDDINPITELLPLTQLEHLHLANCTFTPVSTAHLAECGNRFLPKLKTLSSDCTCFGDRSPFFDCLRPLLTELHLSCYCNFRLPFDSSQFKWNNTHELWPNLRRLALLISEYNSNCPYEYRRMQPGALDSITLYLNWFQQLEELKISPGE